MREARNPRDGHRRAADSRLPGLRGHNARVDLNADVGESFGRWALGDDAAMLTLVTSANVACGFHAGDPIGHPAAPAGWRCESNVVVGAQVGYRDLAGFGRRFMDVARPTSRPT